MKLFTRFLAIAFLLHGISVNASHVAGAKINYLQLDNDTYLVSLSALRDCNSGGLGSAATIDYSGACGNGSMSFQIAYTQNMSQTCDPIGSPSSCNGGTAPGYELVVYQDTLTLAPNCGWVISWDLCCRNTSTNINNATGDDMYVEAIIDPSFTGTNNSPDFLDATIPVVCLNTPVTRDPLGIDIDGDSLVFELVPALDFLPPNPVPVMYNSGYSGAIPITGATVDPATGAISFTPTVAGNFVVVTKVSEYRNGQLIGSTLFDRQFIVTSCNNSNPFSTSAGMQNFTGTAVQTSPYTISMCEGQDFCFDLEFDDSDAGQVLAIESMVTSTLPGATITSTGTGPITATVCWTAPAGSNGFYPVVVSAVDGVCPLQGSVTSAVFVLVTPGTFAGGDVTICNNQGANLGVFGFAPYQWSVLSGDPITIGTNFSCDTCLNAVATPTSTTTYLLTSAAPAGCAVTDTVVVNVVANLTVDASPVDTLVCINQPVQLNTVATPFDPSFSYTWSPTIGINNPNTANPIYSSNNVGVNTLVVNVGNNSGCNEQDTITIEIVSSPLPLDLGFDSIGISAPPVTLNMGMPAGGSYLGAGISGNVFNPSAAGLGTFVLVYQGGGGCGGSSFDTVTVYQDVSIQEILQRGELELIPNPVEEWFSIGSLAAGTIQQVELLDAQGRLIKTWGTAMRRYPVHDMDNGTYFIRAFTEKGILTGQLQIQ